MLINVLMFMIFLYIYIHVKKTCTNLSPEWRMFSGQVTSAAELHQARINAFWQTGKPQSDGRRICSCMKNNNTKCQTRSNAASYHCGLECQTVNRLSFKSIDIRSEVRSCSPSCRILSSAGPPEVLQSSSSSSSSSVSSSVRDGEKRSFHFYLLSPRRKKRGDDKPKCLGFLLRIRASRG